MNDGLVWSPPRPRLFFMHLPKTAGMALRLFLGNQYPVDRIMPANDWRELLSVEIAGLEPNPDAFPVPPDLAVAQESLDRFRFVGLVEDFQEDVLRLSLELGLHPPQPLPKRNFDPEGGGGLNTIAPETLATIRERNPVDVALYEAVKARLAKRPRISRDAAGQALLARSIYRPIAEPVAFAMTGPIPGSNWYACEAAERGGHRWTGPLAQTPV